MSKFDSKTKKVMLSDDEWIEIKTLSFKELKKVTESLDTKNELEMISAMLDMLKSVIVNWNFKDSNGDEVKFSKEKIEDLSTDAIMEIVQEIQTAWNPEKKSSQ